MPRWSKAQNWLRTTDLDKQDILKIYINDKMLITISIIDSSFSTIKLCLNLQGSGTKPKHAVTKKEKTEANRRRKQSLDIEEDDEENRDWWTKYFASLEKVAQVRKLYTFFISTF